MTPTVETYTGRVVSLLEPTPGQITFVDIAMSLSRQTRYNGHTGYIWGYSVAQHSVWVAYAINKLYGVPSQTKLKALLHDAHEAYTGDIIAPVQAIEPLSEIIKPIQKNLQTVIHKAFGIDEPTDEEIAMIKHADHCALAVEAAHLMKSAGEGWDLPDVPDELMKKFRSPLSPNAAFEEFWMAFEYLQKGYPIEELIYERCNPAEENQ